MAPIIAGSLLGAGSSFLNKGLDALLSRLSGKSDNASDFTITGQNLPGTGTNSPGTGTSSLFSKLDADQNGSISKDEIDSFISQGQQAMQSALLDLQAKAQETGQAQAKHHGHHQGGAGQVASKLDKDGNGQVTPDEISAYLAEMAKTLNAQTASQSASSSDGSPVSVTSSASSSTS